MMQTWSVAFAGAALVILGYTANAQSAVDWAAVDAAVGRPGIAQAGDVHRFNFPRSDLRVMVGAVPLRPALALGGWVAMKATPGGVMAMGDLVLTEDEVAAVVSKLQDGGVEQTAIHHHVLNESPRVIYVHVHAHGDPIAIARALHDAVALTRIPSPPPPGVSAPPASDIGIDTAAVARALGAPGRVNGGVLQFSIPRSETIREGAFVIPPTMGLGTAINFQPSGGGKAAITGDFVLLGNEVNPVIRALREGSIEVTALHSHLLAEEPRLTFMHFWANADAVVLARALRRALDRTNSVKATP